VGQDDHDEDKQLKNNTNQNYNENIRTVHMNCFVYSLTDPHATDLCGDVLSTLASFDTAWLANYLAK